MKATNPILKPGPDKDATSAVPAREIDAKLTPKAEAKAANKLPRREQLKNFKKSLEANDPGNQPA